MFLASFNIFWPVARPRSFVIKKSTNAELFGGSSVPACPIPGARCLMSKDTIEPVTMLSLDGRVGLSLAVAIIRPPWIVTSLGDSAVFASKDQAVGTIEELRLSVHALPVTVTVLDVAYDSRFGLTWVFLLLRCET